jgi:putative CocE/NonD family hydrolase
MTGSDGAVTVAFDVSARMRDGVILRANIYRPEGSGPWPTLLTRLPYGKDNPEQMRWLDPVQTARQGFMVVVQDTRGRYRSEGEWEPFKFEREDGYDAVEWAAQLPGSNGRVGMYGCSYVGMTQWLAALDQPPALMAVAPGVTWSEPLDGWLGRGGALEFGLAIAGAMRMHGNQMERSCEPGDNLTRRMTLLFEAYDRLPVDGFWQLPVHEMAPLRQHGVADIGTFSTLSAPIVAERCRVAGQHHKVTVPSLHIAGWYDCFLQGSLDNYVAMAALGREARLIVGPWRHDIALSDPIGERCFGVQSAGVGVPAFEEGDLNDVQRAWFRRHVGSGEPTDMASSLAPVRIFVMGRNEWRDERAWPLERAAIERWFLGHDNSLRREEATNDGAPSQFVYDPGDPVPTVGGQTLIAAAFPAGSFDQRQVEGRDDVRLFTSNPLPADLEVTGRVRVVLHVQSSASSTDWVARLCDVLPDGRSFNLCDGILRVDEGAHEVCRIEIDLWSTSNVFLAGHSIRLHVTSSSFPRWDRNLNTGNQHQASYRIARQSVYHDATRPSWVELPVVP